MNADRLRLRWPLAVAWCLLCTGCEVHLLTLDLRRPAAESRNVETADGQNSAGGGPGAGEEAAAKDGLELTPAEAWMAEQILDAIVPAD